MLVDQLNRAGALQENRPQVAEIKRLRTIINIARERQQQINEALRLKPYTREWVMAVQKVGKLDKKLEQALIFLARLEEKGEGND